MMNAEELEIARRLVACKGWAWFPGMRAIQPADPRCVESVRLTYCVSGKRFMTDQRLNDGTRWVFDGFYQCLGDFPWLPDISDDLTRLGVLAVVRRAWGDEMAYVRPVHHWKPWPRPSWLWVWEAGAEGMRQTGFKDTELEALLDALEAAP